MGKVIKVGVLALQGAFAKHISMLQQLNVQGVEIRKPHELTSCDALVIPGGESTTMIKQIEAMKLSDSLRAFASEKPIFGTCAGMILMAESGFGFVDVAVERNGYGPQRESFQTPVQLSFSKKQPILATFIRAPIIRRYSPEVKILATYAKTPILVQQGKHLSASFHPELSDNTAIHKYFLSLI